MRPRDTKQIARRISARSERVVDGTPIVVFRDGRWNETAIRRLRRHQADICTAAGLWTLGDLDRVVIAIIEHDGAVSILE